MDNKTWARVYQDAQKSCGLKVGDWVKVVDKLEEDNPMWRSWCGRNMNSTVGRVGEIKDISPTGIEVYFGDCQFFYPYFVLEKVDKPAHEFKVYERVLIRKNTLVEWRPAFFSCQHDCEFPYQVIGDNDWYKQCIPYEGNEHLCGKKDAPEDN